LTPLDTRDYGGTRDLEFFGLLLGIKIPSFSIKKQTKEEGKIG